MFFDALISFCVASIILFCLSLFLFLLFPTDRSIGRLVDGWMNEWVDAWIRVLVDEKRKQIQWERKIMLLHPNNWYVQCSLIFKSGYRYIWNFVQSLVIFFKLDCFSRSECRVHWFNASCHFAKIRVEMSSTHQHLSQKTIVFWGYHLNGAAYCT